MAATATTPNTLLGVFLPERSTARVLTGLAVVVAGSLLLALAAQVKVPMLPVPVSLATMAVALIAGSFGWRIGVATVALYIAEGLAGLPFFSNGGGLGYLASPTFGFIVGYLPMALIIGLAADAGFSRRLVPMFATMVVADAVCFAFGYAWLVALSGGATWIDQSNVLGSAFAVAVQPFIVWDLLKMALAALTVAGIWALLRRRSA